jgi:cytochrome c oxidase assembly factor CtaG
VIVASVAGSVPPAFTFPDGLGRWALDPATLLPIAIAATLYAGGVRRVRRHGGRVERMRVVAFAAGMATLTVALASPVDAYADASFTTHMVQHLLITMVAPPLLALAAPLTLALRATAPTTRGRFLIPALRSRVASFLTRPVVGWLAFAATPYVIHLSPWFDAALRNDGLHALEHAAWLVVALVYWWPIVGVDPSPHRMSDPAKLLSLFLAMPAQAFLALTLLTADAPLYAAYGDLPSPWGSGALADQRAAGVTMWVVGNLILVGAILLVAARWSRTDAERARRQERREDEAVAEGPAAGAP